jgi:hypothetical protein
MRFSGRPSEDDQRFIDFVLKRERLSQELPVFVSFNGASSARDNTVVYGLSMSGKLSFENGTQARRGPATAVNRIAFVW